VIIGSFRKKKKVKSFHDEGTCPFLGLQNIAGCFFVTATFTFIRTCRVGPSACSVGWWLMAGAGLF
jgi:hypothetical protein